MEWAKLYDQNTKPSFEDIDRYINNELWEKLKSTLSSATKTPPKLTYSRCSAQPGWNVKYQKSGKSLCTLYPMEGYFIALVVIGNKETVETELLLPTLSIYTQELYQRTSFLCGGRWLMMNVTEPAILEDTLKLITIRLRIK